MIGNPHAVKLRYCQTQGKELIKDSFRRGRRRVVACLPTGAGKTYLTCNMAAEALLRREADPAKFGNTLILTDRRELFRQWIESLAVFGLRPQFIRSKIYKDVFSPNYPLTLAMVESFYRRQQAIPNLLDELNIKFVIVDEAHKDAFRKVLFDYKGFVIGLTATPLSSGPVPLKEQYDDLIIPTKTSSLIMAGDIVGCDTYSIKHDFRGLVRNSRGEFTEDSQLKEFRKAHIYDGLINAWLTHANGLPTFCYNINIEHSQETNDKFLAAGITAEHIDSTMSGEEIDCVMDRFRLGMTKVVNNVGLLTTGNDEQMVECVATNRGVGLISTATQIWGRGARSYTRHDGTSKQKFVHLDLGANHARLGVFGQDVDWRQVWNEPAAIKEDPLSITPDTVTCANCAGVYSQSLPACIYCEQPTPEKTSGRTFEVLVAEAKRLEKIREQELEASMPASIKGVPVAQMSDSQLWTYINHKKLNPKFFYTLRSKQRALRKRHA